MIIHYLNQPLAASVSVCWSFYWCNFSGNTKFMKIYYIIAMYIARLEFLSVFALVGYVIGGMKKLCLKIL